MSAAPLDDRINARAQLEHVARGLYADPTAALRAMRYDAHAEGAEAVRSKLEHDFTQYGEAVARVQGPARERAQMVLRDGGVAADVERWLRLDHTPSGPQLVRDGDIDRVMRAPDAEELGREPADARRASGTELVAGLNAEERLAYDQLEAFVDAKERADQRQAAEARLHAIHDHRESLAAAEASVPRAKAALRNEVERTYPDSPKAMERIEAAMERDGPAETARRIRTGELLKKDQKKVTAPKRTLGIFPRRDQAAQAAARERVAQRIETIGYYEGDLGKWSTHQPQDGSAVHGAMNVRAALDREEAKIVANGGIGLSRGEVERNRPAPPHPTREASQLGRVAQQHLERLPPESRERVMRAARQTGGARMGAALGHLQTIQWATRSFREGIEGPGN